MNYKGIQLPLTRTDAETGDRIPEVHTIESVTFNPNIVTFESGVVLDWKYSEEEFNNYIESLKYPTFKEVLDEFLQSKEVCIAGHWCKILKINPENSVLVVEKDGVEDLHFLDYGLHYKVRDLKSDLDNSKS